MTGFSPRSVLGVGALCATLLLSACSAQQDAALQPPSPTSPSSSANATSSTSPTDATGSASASSDASRSPGSVASVSSSPTAAQPTVVEQAPAASSKTQPEASTKPTGTVTTVEPAPPTETVRPSTAQASTPGQAANDACRLGQTVISAEAKGGAGAAGSQYLTLTFTNNGSDTCSVSGYPSVSYVDESGQTIGAPASLAAEWTSSAVTLEPGQSTTAILRETRADLFGDRCKPVTSAGYRVQLPQTTESLTIPYPSEGCSDASIQQLSVGQVGASV